MANINKLALVVTYFGSFPEYMGYFLQSASYNKEIDFIIFTDNDTSLYQAYDNIKYVTFSLEKFNILASSRFGLLVDIKYAYKLCDLKPMYGFIYEIYLLNYDYWGYCDIDIVMGDISKYLTDKMGRYDIITSHARYMSGAFSLYRNTQQVNQIFTLSKDYKKVLLQDKIFCFDEASNVISSLWHGGDIADIQSEVESITHVLKNKRHGLSVLFGGFITEKTQDIITWEAGKLKDGEKEILIFHFLIYKGKITFNVPPFGDKTRFIFENGFSDERLASYTYYRIRSIYRNLSRKVINKIKLVISAS